MMPMGGGGKSYRPRRVDANQRAVRRALEEAFGEAISIDDISSQGGGVPDLLIGAGGVTVLMEVKNLKGRRTSKTQKGLHTPAQQRFRARWQGGIVATVFSPEEAVERMRGLIG